jgi:adenylylsulfate kinase-like enzyme
VIVSAISPYEEMRRHARSLVEQHSPFVEIYVATSLEECARRDPKGLYAAAFAGEIEDFTGVSAPYEEPLTPELRLETKGRMPSESAAAVLDRLEELNLVPKRTESEL